MKSKPKTARSLAVLLVAAALSLALTASATAVIYVYGNGFPSKQAFKEITRGGGGKKNCGKRFREKAHIMRVHVIGKRLCDFEPPVVGDSSSPNHVIYAKGTVLRKQNPKALRDAGYLAVRARAGGGNNYELQIRPKGKRFKLTRSPASGAVSESGTSDAINKLGRHNTLRLEVKGDRVRAVVNGEELASVVDPNANQVTGRRVAFGIGSRKDAEREILGSFKRIRVGIP
jgi:hypothetical protein